MKQEKLNKILIGVLVVLIAFIIWQKATEPYRTIFNDCYYIDVSEYSMASDKEWLKERKEYCQDLAREAIEERGD